MKLVPVNDYVLVRREKASDKSKGGVVIPDAAKEKQSRGEILAVGPGHHTDEGVFVAMHRQVGEVVLFTRYAGDEVDETFGEGLLMVREGNILAVIE